ncbi:cytochrome C oxidase subunit II [Variovorax sp. PAMC28562]|nr:cytochrome C oxidase subunit II [Variovorax sp. PAMC28562]QNK72760.1 cytochrome C oxidase subunit II [Variovorax sp. PAMC28562]
MASLLKSADGGGAEQVALQAEKRWAVLIGLITAALVLLMIFTALHWATMPPSRVETVNPSTLHIAGEFVESNLGTAVEKDGGVVVRLIGQQYSFTPQCIVVPEGMSVTFRATSADVIHGFIVGKSNVNTMLVPGFVTTFTTTFTEKGEKLMPCHEFCGAGHEGMWGRVQVVERNEFLARAAASERVSCVAQ